MSPSVTASRCSVSLAQDDGARAPRGGLQEGRRRRSSTRPCRSSSATSWSRPRRPAPSSPTHGRGEVEGLGRDPRAQRGDRPAGEAGRPAGAGRPAQRRATRWRRPRPTSTWPRPGSTNATSQKRRADELFKTQSITEQEHEQALLDYADASAAGGAGAGGGGQRPDPARGHRRPRADHRHHHREGRRARARSSPRRPAT